MFCPYCKKQVTIVKNTRHTKGNRTWRRRFCTYCKITFTTHEVVDLTHLKVLKKSGVSEVFSKAKLFLGIYNAMAGSKVPGKEKLIDEITKSVEEEILFQKKNRVESKLIGDIILRVLIKYDTETFIRYFARFRRVRDLSQFKKYLEKYQTLLTIDKEGKA